MKESLIILLAILLSFTAYSQHAKTKAKQTTASKPVASKPAAYAPKKAPPVSTATKKATPTKVVAKPAPPPQKPPRQTTVVKPAPAPVRPQEQTTVNKPVEKAINKPTVSRKSGGGYSKGDNLLNIGVGLSSYYSYSNPIGLSYEVGRYPNLSIGGQFDYLSSNNRHYSEGFSSFYLGGRASYHANEILNISDEKIDLYAGVGLGYRSFRWRNSNYYYSGYYSRYNSGLFFNYFVGGKYYFSDKFGAFVELGYTGLSSSRIGITVKL